MKIDLQTYPVYYHSYIEKVPKGEPLELLDFVLKESLKTLVMISEDKGSYRYAEGKWSIKDILQHLIDTERIFCFRALSFARGEQKEIFGYDHDAYVENAKADLRTVKSLLEELRRVRQSTIDLFQSFSDEMMFKKGKANGVELSVAQILYIILGHEIHHIGVIEEKYLF